MAVYSLYIAAALYLGVLTSISPCPLATNIAAISYVGRKVGHSRSVIQAGLLYTVGRCLVYLALAVVLSASAMSIPAVANFLQKYAMQVLAPLFLLIGIFLLGLVEFDIGGAAMTPRLQARIDAMGIWGALALGALFAVSFCPTSAAWFFGLLAVVMGSEAGAVTTLLSQVGIELPQASLSGSVVVLPVIYGIGTALPVLLVAFVLAFSAKSVGKAYNAMAKVEWWSRRITGWLFVGLGVFFSARYVFEAF